MKKTVQITLAGILFQIEEDAYTTLQQYLSSINTYFSSYEGHEEIVADIEARMAEKFLNHQKPEEASLITIVEVEKMMQSMGSVADFEAMEEEAAFDHTGTQQKDFQNTTKTTSRKLVRDGNNKALAGVLGGLAHYLRIDVVWLRVIFILLLAISLESGAFLGFLIAYVILWIALPESKTLEDLKNVKKFYRDPEGKTIAGVATGLSNYMNVDVSIIRIIFMALIFFFGFGILAYMVLWMVSPIAKSLTQKMEMKGEPVTLENIEQNIKLNIQETQNAAPAPKENLLKRILLFPFELIGILFSAIGTALSHLGPVLRFFIGLLLFALGLSTFISAVAGTAMFFGLTSQQDFFRGDDIVQLFVRDFPPSAGVFLFLATAIPTLALILSGIILMTRKQIGTRNFWLTGLGLWIAGLIGVGFYGGTYAMNYAKKGEVKEEINYSIPAGPIYLAVSDQEYENEFKQDVRLRIKLAKDGEYKLVKSLTAAGSNHDEAKENARAIVYSISQRDSLLLFDRFLKLDEQASFRAQQVSLELYVPANHPIKMSNDLANYLLHDSWRFENDYGIESDDFEKLTFYLNEDGELKCKDCPELTEEQRAAIRDRDFRNHDADFDRNYEHQRLYDINGFSGIEVSSSIKIDVRQGDTYRVELLTNNPENLEDIRIEKIGNTLDISLEDRFKIFNDLDVTVKITMPKLENLELSGATAGKVVHFQNQDRLNVDISGASSLQLDADAKNINLDLSGASSVELIGRIDKLSVDLSGASSLEADRAKIIDADVEASGASHAEFSNVAGRLRQEVSGASEVEVR